MNKRHVLVIVSLLVLNLLIFVISLSVGEYRIPFWEVIQTLFGSGEKKAEFIVQTLRLPRILVAFFVGAGLSLAGMILQALTRNPLASPGVIGLNAGAGLGAIITIVLFPSIPFSLVPLSAFIGALAAGVIAYLLAWKNGSSPLRLILTGIGIAAIAQALIQIVQMHGKIQLVTKATIWLVGSVYGRGWEHVWSLVLWILPLIVLTFFLISHLNVLHLGDDIARGLGSRNEWNRGRLILISIALTGVAVANAGVLSFVGLMAPHIARKIVGASHGILSITSVLVGGWIVMTADLLGRVMFAPIEIPCGIITSIVGAPYLLYLLFRK